MNAISRTFALTAVVLSGACKEAPRASLELEDATVFLFTNFNGDAEELGFAVQDLEAAISASGIDLEASARDRAFTVPRLNSSTIGDLQQVPGTEFESQIPTVALGLSRHDYAANLALVAETNHVCIESDSTVSYTREFLSDLACFESGSCDTVQTTNAVRKENILAKAWYDLFKDYRQVELDDGRTAMIARSWTEEIFYGDNGSNNFAQNYTIEAWIPDGDSTLRAYGIWAEINIGLGDDLMQGQIIDGLVEGFGNADDFIDDETAAFCDNDRNEVFERE